MFQGNSIKKPLGLTCKSQHVKILLNFSIDLVESINLVESSRSSRIKNLVATTALFFQWCAKRKPKLVLMGLADI